MNFKILNQSYDGSNNTSISVFIKQKKNLIIVATTQTRRETKQKIKMNKK